MLRSIEKVLDSGPAHTVTLCNSLLKTSAHSRLAACYLCLGCVCSLLQLACSAASAMQDLIACGAAGTPPLRLLSKALHAWLTRGELSLEELAGALSQGCEAATPPTCTQQGCDYLAACVASLPPAPPARELSSAAAELLCSEGQPSVDALDAARGCEHTPAPLDAALQRLLNCVLRPLPVGGAAALAAAALAGINQVSGRVQCSLLRASSQLCLVASA